MTAWPVGCLLARPTVGKGRIQSVVIAAMVRVPRGDRIAAFAGARELR